MRLRENKIVDTWTYVIMLIAFSYSKCLDYNTDSKREPKDLGSNSVQNEMITSIVIRGLYLKFMAELSSL